MILEIKHVYKNDTKDRKYCILICDICGKKFRRKYYKSIQAKNHYCCIECSKKCQKGRPKSEEWKNKIRGFKHTEEAKNKISIKNSGIGNGMYGKLGELSPNWNGGKYSDNRGYIIEKRNGVRKAEHRYLIEDSFGRELTSGEEVHHLDENKSNNDLDNLIVFTKKDHRTYHLVKRVLDNYGSLDNFIEQVAITC